MSWVLGWLLVALVAVVTSPLLAGWPLWALALTGVPVVSGALIVSWVLSRWAVG